MLKGYSTASGCLAHPNTPQIFQGGAEVTLGSQDWEVLQLREGCGTPRGLVAVGISLSPPLCSSSWPRAGCPRLRNPFLWDTKPLAHPQQLGRGFQSTFPPLKLPHSGSAPSSRAGDLLSGSTPSIFRQLFLPLRGRALFLATRGP